ncbi:hypothetical protein NLU13_8062 [Sarocladium strictum]|uniref:Minor extracellular protease vpr n=1 Tax=Sarocladium strictum TaxID=5046 RepID=A0AA39L4L8_SARSR|nr:hypothetical protein NLU13_8062 [Sarocladium strictum]
MCKGHHHSLVYRKTAVMHWTVTFAITLLGGFGLTANAAEDSELQPILNSFIIEYDSDLATQVNSLAADDGNDIKLIKSFSSDVFTGASVETAKENMDTLGQLPGVKRVWRNRQIALAVPTPDFVPDDVAAQEYTTHNATGVSKLHALGYFGKGVKVGVVDTGTAWDHPALGGCFGQGCKIAGGYDLVGNGQWPYEPKAPDEDPMDQQGHGTHVAGIIAGKSESWIGVAPEATIYSYKVFSRASGTDEETLIESFLRAYEDGCDIITASIGGPSGWADGAWAEVASRLVDRGVVVTISAGNSGDNGAFWASNGSSGKGVIAVASVETEVFPASPFNATFATQEGEEDTVTLGYLPSTDYFPPTVKDWPIVPMNMDVVDDDGCAPYPEDTPRIEGYIPLVRRGTCTFETKQKNLEALGAQYILFYNNDAPLVTPGTGFVMDSLIALITAKAGAEILKTFKAGGEVTADFSGNPEAVVGLEYPAGGRPSTFTSWGGTYDLQIKPEIAAPGGQIFSTWPNGQFALLSGTSMACPYVAGVAALYIGVHGGRDVHGAGFAHMLRQRIVSSGVALPWSGDGTAQGFDFTAPVAQVGSGLVDAWKVLAYSTSLAFDSFALNDTRYFSRYHDVTVANNGDEPVTYKFSLAPAAGFETMGVFDAPLKGDKRLFSRRELTPVQLVPRVYLPKDFTLQPGQSKTVSVNFDNPDQLGWNANGLPLYSGNILIQGSNGEQLAVPYMGLGADLKRQMTPIFRATYPFSRSGINLQNINQKPWYTFNLSLTAQDFPKIYVKLVWGSRELRWDIYDTTYKEHQWRYPPVVGQNGYIGTVAGWNGATTNINFDPRRHDANDTFNFPDTNLFRNAQASNSYHEFWWFGKLGNGSQIELGKYQMRFAALRPFGDPKASDAWDVFKTPVIEVRGKY